VFPEGVIYFPRLYACMQAGRCAVPALHFFFVIFFLACSACAGPSALHARTKRAGCMNFLLFLRFFFNTARCEGPALYCMHAQVCNLQAADLQVCVCVYQAVVSV
jgi:hypothetical protein